MLLHESMLVYGGCGTVAARDAFVIFVCIDLLCRFFVVTLFYVCYMLLKRLKFEQKERALQKALRRNGNTDDMIFIGNSMQKKTV
jgi:hypothetical protein